MDIEADVPCRAVAAASAEARTFVSSAVAFHLR